MGGDVRVIIGIAYGVVALGVAGVASRRLAWWLRDGGCSFGAEEGVLSLLFGLLVGGLWPVALPGALFVRWLTADVGRNHPEEVERRAREAEARVRELERELGIGAQEDQSHHSALIGWLRENPPLRPGSSEGGVLR